MTGEFISPNLHVCLIHFPMALLIIGVSVELFSFLFPRSSLGNGARWMILLGALSTVPATFSGIYALSDIARTNNPVGDVPWEDVKAASPWLSQPAVWQVMRTHVIYQSAATAMSVIAVLIWLGCSDQGRKAMHWPVLVLLVGSVVVIIVGAWNGGELIYRHGVGVQTAAVVETGQTTKEKILHQIPPPVELHVIAAGCAIAIALAAIGLSCRKLNARFDYAAPGNQATGENSARQSSDALVMIRSFNPGIEVNVDPCAPAARCWMLAFVLAMATAGLGILVLAINSDALTLAKQTHHPIWKVLWEQIKPSDGTKVNRALGHVVMGSTIVILPLILAALARFAPRWRFFFTFFTLILILAVSAQIWLGVLLLLDTSDGPINKFNPAEAAATH
jgi:uncharacterized membrane protein